MKAKLKLLFQILLSLLIVAGLGWALTRDVFRISDFAVNPAQKAVVSTSSVQKAIFETIQNNLQPKLTDFAGKYLWEVDLGSIRSLVLDEPRVKSVHIRRRFPNKVDIRYAPYEPKFLYMSRKNEFFPVTEKGSLLPKSTLLEWGSLPIYRGTNLKRDKKNLETVVEFVRLMPKEGSFGLDVVSEMKFSKKRGLELSLSKTNTRVRLGQSQYSEKIKRVNKVLSYLESKNISARVIDARFLKKVVVKPRNTP